MNEFVTGRECEVLSDTGNTPVSAAFAVVEGAKGFMLLYNKYRRLWELAGGMLEPGETPRDCAARECMEESGQRLCSLEFMGLVKYASMNAAIYYAYLDNEAPFVENDEIQALRWFKTGADTAGMCGESVRFIRMRRPNF